MSGARLGPAGHGYAPTSSVSMPLLVSRMRTALDAHPGPGVEKPPQRGNGIH
ncbi:MAG: hypothetical protein ACRDTE_00370 [Pseudonocardiaceae bacterium]